MTEEKQEVKTQCKIEREERYLAIYRDWSDMMSRPGAMATAVTENLQRKYNLYSTSAVWNSRKKGEKLAQLQTQE